MLVKDYMTPEPLTVGVGEAVNWIAELIREHGIRQVAVVDGRNRLVGIVTDRDIRSADASPGGRGNKLRAEDIMTTALHTIAPSSDLLEAARLLHQHQIGALPVVIGDQVVGMITRGDLLRRLMELLQRPEHAEEHPYVSPFAF